ncbi:RNA polymerase sigma-70 factor (ECF subfamily) [Kibdelosporangium banguiense]|uniref:RNA polymerase sigma-70 factor (ECF subfamily) n=1 Tax=Kibdelosporangium banguiense TaxID=1365924 RepID=A0ABS4TL09_9PSEU|nr:zf-HC2 domain-containing protein [Kibdelosporangium banguiense]MBP2324684.1 RNA polymerase sigma-70 factor (ECF subfamily) [Kibdelosporangium banguiense]
MTSPTDPYREWDVAYVLGSLSPAEREEYEQHLSTCDECSAAVASFESMPAVLSAVPKEQAAELLDAPAEADLMPSLARAARTSRRWSRIRIGAALVGAAAAGAVLTIFLRAPEPVPQQQQAFPTMLTQTIPSPVTASVNLVEEPWGTRIEIKCDYAVPKGGQGRSLGYALFVVDSSGTASQVGTWNAGPGTSMTPSASTDVPRSKITRIEIRLLNSDKALLEARF